MIAFVVRLKSRAHFIIQRNSAQGREALLGSAARRRVDARMRLGILIAAHAQVERAGGELKLCKVSRRVESILMVTRLNMIFESYADEAQALASF